MVAKTASLLVNFEMSLVVILWFLSFQALLLYPAILVYFDLQSVILCSWGESSYCRYPSFAAPSYYLQLSVNFKWAHSHSLIKVFDLKAFFLKFIHYFSLKIVLLRNALGEIRPLILLRAQWKSLQERISLPLNHCLISILSCPLLEYHMNWRTYLTSIKFNSSRSCHLYHLPYFRWLQDVCAPLWNPISLADRDSMNL